MSEMHLRQLGFTFGVCVHSLQIKNKKLKKQENQYIFIKTY